MMNRRGFLGAILAAGVSPAVVRAASLMPVRVLDSGIALLDGNDWVQFLPLGDPSEGWHRGRRIVLSSGAICQDGKLRFFDGTNWHTP